MLKLHAVNKARNIGLPSPQPLNGMQALYVVASSIDHQLANPAATLVRFSALDIDNLLVFLLGDITEDLEVLLNRAAMVFPVCPFSFFFSFSFSFSYSFSRVCATVSWLFA